MNRRNLFAVAIALTMLFCLGVSAHAQKGKLLTHYPFYVKVQFGKQGASKGESPRKDRKDWLTGVGFSFALISPRDMATGQQSGKRQYRPIVFTKEWGASSPQFLQAVATNEILPSVRIEFTKVNGNGTEYVYQTITLTNASISSVKQKSGRDIASPTTDVEELEEISLTFQKIEVENRDGKTLFADDWDPYL